MILQQLAPLAVSGRAIWPLLTASYLPHLWDKTLHVALSVKSSALCTVAEPSALPNCCPSQLLCFTGIARPSPSFNTAKPIIQHGQAHLQHSQARHSIRPSPSFPTAKPIIHYSQARHSIQPSPSFTTAKPISNMAKPVIQYGQAHHPVRPSPPFNTAEPIIQCGQASHSTRPSPSSYTSGSAKYKLTMCVAVQGGNNNTYCHDSELNWFNWDQAARDESGYARFFRHLVNFRCAITHFSWAKPLAWLTLVLQIDRNTFAKGMQPYLCTRGKSLVWLTLSLRIDCITFARGMMRRQVGSLPHGHDI